jgi:hypothetical protein
MCRLVASNVSALSDRVANVDQTMHHVSCSPSKIPYGGFSPVRLQTGCQRQPSSSTSRLKCKVHIPRKTRDLYATTAAVSGTYGPRGHGRRHRLTPASSPEALGSPQGYALPAGHRLLQPHPQLWRQGLAYLLRPAPRTLRPCMGWSPQRPQFALHVCVYVPLSVPRRSEWLHLTVASPPALASTLFARAWLPLAHAVGSRVDSVTRLQNSLHAAARTLARPSPTRTFTFELSLPESPPRNVEYNYTGTQSIPMAGLSPARHTALWAASKVTQRSQRKNSRKR